MTLTEPTPRNRRNIVAVNGEPLCVLHGPDHRASLLAFAREFRRDHRSNDPRWNAILDALIQLRLEHELATGTLTADITTEARP